jgi:hypothetical protein
VTDECEVCGAELIDGRCHERHYDDPIEVD